MNTIHVTLLKPGDVLRIALKAGMHLEPVPPPRRGEQAGLRLPSHPRVARNFSRTSFNGLITTNDPQQGQFTLQVRPPGGDVFAAVVPYKAILYAQKLIAKLVPHTIPVGGGPRAVRHPGVRALGSYDTIDRPFRLRVTF